MSQTRIYYVYNLIHEKVHPVISKAIDPTIKKYGLYCFYSYPEAKSNKIEFTIGVSHFSKYYNIINTNFKKQTLYIDSNSNTEKKIESGEFVTELLDKINVLLNNIIVDVYGK